jgi:hypothetical protein
MGTSDAGKFTDMSLKVIARTEMTQANWDALVCNSPDGWVYSLWGWQDLILQVPRWDFKDHSFGVVSAGQLIAVVPLQYSPNSRILSSSGWGGSGPVISERYGLKKRQDIIKFTIDHCIEVAKLCKAKKIGYSASPVTRSSLAASWGVNLFEMCGMRDCSRLSQVIDLSLPESELWNGLSSTAKRKIRKATNSGYRAERTCWIDNIQQYFELHSSTYLRTGESPHPIEYFSGIANHLSKDGYSVLWRALDKEGNVCSYHNMARFKEGAYYHTGCSLPTAAELGVNYLLFWEAMLGAKKMGVRWYDAGWIFPHGATAKQKGLTHFKTRFGGEVHRSFFAELEMSPQKINDLAVPPPPSLLKRIVGRILEK